MKKSLIALAALAATGAFAQSSVTLSGALDVAYQKVDGSKAAMTQTHGSRFRLVGTEDLGGGLKANFNIEHRLNLTNGTNSGAALSNGAAGNSEDNALTDTFWNGVSTAGLSGSFGSVNFGRQYTAGFLSANNKADPFGGDGFGNLRGVGMRTTNVNGTLRSASTIGYTNNFGPVSVHLTSGDQLTGIKRHTGVALGFTQGAFSAGFGKDTGTDGTEVTNFYGGYNMGFANLTVGMGETGGTAAKTKGNLIAVSAPAAGGTVKAGYASAENAAGVKTNSKIGLGYTYDLSKRTRIDTTYGRDSKAAVKSGYDVTLTHAF
jgi:predicted porin